MSYIEIEHYTKKIKKNVVLDDICLSLEKNKIYGFVGINGSGKTMLLRAISGMISPTSGKVTVDGVVVGKGIHPKSTSILIENADLWADMTALESLNLLNAFSSNKVSRERIKETLSKFGLDPQSKKPYKAFSLGMKQKLRLSQVFMADNDLLILDEPTNALDEQSIGILRSEILHRKEIGSTVLLASHSKVDIECLCDEIIFMKDAKVVKQEKRNGNEES